MEKMAAVSVVERCSQLFGIEIERERVEVLASELAGILREVEKLRELDLADVPPVVVFDPDRVYRETGND